MIDYVLKASLDRGCIITVMYQKENLTTIRNIKVIDIEEDYVKAFCYLRKQSRVFKKENILAAEFCRKLAAV